MFRKTPLINAVRRDQLDAARLLLESGANPELKDHDEEEYMYLRYGLSRTAFSYARSAEMMQLLLDHGATVNLGDWRDDLADDGGIDHSKFHDLCEYGDIEMVRILLKEGCSVNRQINVREDYSTPLDRAVRQDRLDVVRLILDYKPTMKTLSNALFLVKSVEAAQILVNHGADIHHQEYFGEIPIDIAKGEVKEFFQKQHDLVKKRVDAGNSTIHEAVFYGNLEMVKRLIEDGTDVNVQDERGATPLYIAAWRRHPKLIRYLLDNGGDKTIRCRCYTPYSRLNSYHDLSDEMKKLRQELYFKR